MRGKYLNNALKLDMMSHKLSSQIRYSVLGNEDFGYTMLHRAIEMAEELRIVNFDKLNLNKSQFSEEMVRSIKRTAWGIFQIDTYVFVRQALYT